MKRIVYLYLALLLTALAGAGIHIARAHAATGGNFFATGHDLDHHCAFGHQTDSCDYLKVLVDKARNGSTLPILALDQFTELQTSLTGLYGAAHVVRVDPSDATAFNATRFVGPTGTPLYSAIVTASDNTCNGCDNTLVGESNINARSADFAAFYNAGGGIVALTGATHYATYYNFVPFIGLAGADLPCNNSTGDTCFAVTPAGAALGVTNAEVNCSKSNPLGCETHNSFNEPPAPPFIVVERVAPGMPGANDPVTIGVLNGMISGGGFKGGGTATPELGSGELFATGVLPLAAVLLYRRRKARRVAAQPRDPAA